MLAILPLLFFAVPTFASASTLYYNAAVDNHWENLDNWWDDAGFSDPAAAIPTVSDDVIVSAIIDSNSGDPASVNTLTITDGGIAIDVTAADGATFNGSSYLDGGTITGNAIFNDTSYNQGTITGDATFNATTYHSSAPIGGVFTFSTANWQGSVGGTVYGSDDVAITSYVFTGEYFNHSNGTINGDVIFNDTSYNEGVINGDATFNDSSSSGGTINGDADVYFPAENPLGGAVTGSITYHNYPVADFYFGGEEDNDWNNVNNWWTDYARTVHALSIPTITDDVFITVGIDDNNGAPASVNTLVIQSAGIAIDITVANGATFNVEGVLNGVLTGNATFNDESYIGGVVEGDVIFNDESGNFGTITGNATFNTTLYHTSAPTGGVFTFTSGGWEGEVTGTVYGSDDVEITSYIFNDETTNQGTTTADTIFNDSSENYGGVTGNATLIVPLIVAAP